ncbi:MAG TPA: hypothetical protein VLW52_01665 [Opitutaceae bacterium]|nr:hypothetical protein [Opitutaceae bacterium]
MLDRQSNAPSRVTLEDLLHLKRAERPPPEFWAEFERQLREKQLAALVEKKSWWHELAVVYRVIGRVRLPLAAVAVLALTFVSIRYYTLPEGSPAMAARNPALQTPARPVASPPEIARPVTAPVPTVVVRPPAEQSSVSLEKSAAVAAEDSPAASGEVLRVIPWLGDVLENHADAAGLTPSARTIAANLATAAVMEPELLDAIARSRGFEERAMPAAYQRHTAEALPTAAAVADPRRARLLASLESGGAYVPEPSAPEHAQRSVTRYLAQDGWDHSISRLEAEGNRLSIRF